MPLCQICKQREATVFLTQIYNGQKADMYVCAQCAGASGGMQIDLKTLIAGLFGMAGDEAVDESPVLKCDRCAMTIEEFNKTGKMGCSHCYKVFSEPMQALLKRIQGNTRHHGKLPKRFQKEADTEQELLRLKEELKECIKEEAYEKAAEIRDQIKAYELEGGRT